MRSRVEKGDVLGCIPSTEDTVTLAQEGLNIFAEEAREPGGQVSVHKTNWYLLDFTWDPSGKWNLVNKKDNISLQI